MLHYSLVFDYEITRLATTDEHNHDEFHYSPSTKFHSFVMHHASLVFDYEIARLATTGEHDHDELYN